MKIVSKIALSFVLSFSVVSAHAQGFGLYTKITHIAVGGAYGNEVVVRTANHNDPTRPACADNGEWTFAFSISDSKGKAAYSMLLLAQSTGAPVLVSLENHCNSRFTDIAQMRWVRMKSE